MYQAYLKCNKEYQNKNIKFKDLLKQSVNYEYNYICNNQLLVSLVYINISKSIMISQPNYRLIRVIGSGVFGYVFQAQNRNTKKKVALKRIQKASNSLSRQYEILHMIQGCQNIVKIEDIFYSRNDQNKLIQNMVFEYVEDNLESLVQRNLKAQTKIKQSDIKNYMYQLLNGLAWIHSKKVAHRDLKPQNVLLSKNGVVKICDFGSSKVIDQKGRNTPYIVSRYYRAPELIMCITKYSVEVDIWAAGCILAELFLLSPLFKGKTEGDQLFKIFQIIGSFTTQQAKEYKSLVPFDTTLFKQFQGYQRTNLQQLFHMVTDRKNFIDLLLKMLCYSTSKRISAVDAMNHPFFKSINLKKAQESPKVVNTQEKQITQAY